MPKKILKIAFSHTNPVKFWPYGFRSRGTTESSILDHDSGLSCRGRRNQLSGHSDFGTFNNLWASSIFTWVYADTASAACASQPGNLDMISMILTAVICDADDPWSLNTAQEPESSFTRSHRSTTRPLDFWCSATNYAFFKWQTSISEAKWTVAPFVLASSISFLLLTFAKFHAEILQFLNSLSTAAYAAGIFHSLPLPAIWSSWWFGNVSPIRSLVDSLASRIHARFVLIFLDAPDPQILLFLFILQDIAGAIGVSKFLRAFLMVSLSSWSMKLFVRPHLLLFQLGILSHFIQRSGHKWSGRDVSYFLVNLSPEHIYLSGSFSYKNEINLSKDQTYLNDSRRDIHRLSRIPRIFQCEWLLASYRAPRTFASFSGFPVKFWFCTDMPGSIEWSSPAPRLHIGDCFEIRNCHFWPCDLLLSSHQIFQHELRVRNEYKHCAYPKPHVSCMCALKILHEENWRVSLFPSDNATGVYSRTLIVKKISNSLTYTVASSWVWTSTLAVLTIVGLHDFVKVSISASLKSFLLIMCIDAPESTTNSLSSGLRDECRQAPIFRRWEDCCSFLLLKFEHTFDQLPRCFAGTLLLPLSPPATDLQILERWNCADEVLLGKKIRPKDFGLEFLCDVQWLSRISHVALVSACLSSSARWASAASCLERHNPIVVYSMICAQQVRASTHDKCHAWQWVAPICRDFRHGWQQVAMFLRASHTSSTWLLHFCHHSFSTFPTLFKTLTMCTRTLFPKSPTTLGLVEQAFWREPPFTEWIGASSLKVILARPSRRSSTKSFVSGTWGSRRIYLTLLHETIWRRIRLCHFCTFVMSWRKLQLSQLKNCPWASHCQRSPRILCPRCFVSWFLTTAFLSYFPFLAPLDTSFYHHLQSVITKSYVLLMNLQVIQFQYGLKALAR